MLVLRASTVGVLFFFLCNAASYAKRRQDFALSCSLGRDAWPTRSRFLGSIIFFRSWLNQLLGKVILALPNSQAGCSLTFAFNGGKTFAKKRAVLVLTGADKRAKGQVFLFQFQSPQKLRLVRVSIDE